MDKQMESKPEQKGIKHSRKGITGNKTFLIVVSCWFLFYIFISLNGSGG